MDTIVINAEFEEVKSIFSQGDLSLGSRFLLDFLTDVSLDTQYLEKALALRAKYNLMEVGKSSKEDIKTEYTQFLDEISRELKLPLKEEEKEEKSSIANLDQYNLSEKETNHFPEAFRCIQLSKSYNSVGFELKNIDLSLRLGQITGVVGENGNGKTTLLRMIAGNLSPTNGVLGFPNLEFPAKDWRFIKQNIAYIPQRIPKWTGYLKNNLHFSATGHGILGKENEARVNYIIHRLGLTKYEKSKWSEISSGYKLRFELARTLLWRPQVLILDEPLANLDINAKMIFLQDLKMLARSKKYPIAIILSSQQLHELESVVDNIVFLKEGKAVYNGKVAELGEDRSENTFEIAGDFSRKELTDILQNINNVNIEETGNGFLIKVPVETEIKQILALILNEKPLEYFRDISKSTRKYFE